MSSESAASRGIGRWATALLAIGGLVIAWYLTEFHVQAVVGEAVGGALCDAHSVVDCDSAVHSRYSTLFGIPISLLGVAFYAAVLSLVLFDRESVRNSDDPYRPAAIAVSTFFLGLTYSVFLAGVSAFELGTLCPFCAMLYAVNLLGLITASTWAGKWPHTIAKAQLRRPASFFNGWTGLFAFSFAIALFVGNSVLHSEIRNRQAQQEDPVAEELLRIDPGEYRVDDAPAKGPEDAVVHIVEFSNFPCPYCKRLAGVLHRIHQEYPEEVRIEFRHFPIAAQEYGHLAARAGYCADEQGQFWPMHDQLFAGAPDLDRESVGEYASHVGLDARRFDECLDSERAHRRIDEDVEAGKRLGIQGTPTFFLNGMLIRGVRPYEVIVGFIEEEFELADRQGDGS